MFEMLIDHPSELGIIIRYDSSQTSGNICNFFCVHKHRVSLFRNLRVKTVRWGEILNSLQTNYTG